MSQLPLGLGHHPKGLGVTGEGAVHVSAGEVLKLAGGCRELVHDIGARVCVRVLVRLGLGLSLLRLFTEHASDERTKLDVTEFGHLPRPSCLNQ
ncbi:hypothetical protein ACFWZY_17105 [Streptomyces sp. NPDC058992]|uniref:hypothetical protein n=1 Tax=Streptomyces sp. NPDC058992 TaxID=3346688 RepID=UPI00367C3A42